MFEFEDLNRFSIEVDFSENLPSEDMTSRSAEQMLQKINLGMLKTSFFSDVQVAFRELGAMLPNIAYSQAFEQHRVEMAIFKKKMRLDIHKLSKTVSITLKTETGERKKPKAFTWQAVKKIGIDFNFLLGKMLGILKIEGIPKTETKLVFSKEEKILPCKKLQFLKENVSTVLDSPKADIVGLNISLFDSKNIKHILEFSQSKEKFSFKDTFEFEPSAPPILPDIIKKSQKLGNEILRKVF